MTHGGRSIRCLATGILMLSGAVWAAMGRPSHADPPLPSLNATVSGGVVLFGKPVPLPPGSWRVASSGFGGVEGGDPGAYGAIGGVLLVPVGTGRSYGAFVLVHTNALPVRGGWGQPAECADERALFRDATEPRDFHHACSFVIDVATGHQTVRSIPALAATEDAPLPSRALIAGLRVSDRRDVVDVRYGFAVPDWNEDPERAAIAERLSHWIQEARPQVATAMRTPDAGGLGLAEPPLHPATPVGEAEAGDMSTLRFALYKLLTYRLVSSATTMTVGTVVTGNPVTGAWLTLWQGLTHSAVYFLNELAWEWPQNAPVMTFTRMRGQS